jgi:hypothetical protein
MHLTVATYQLSTILECIFLAVLMYKLPLIYERYCGLLEKIIYLLILITCGKRNGERVIAD